MATDLNGLSALTRHSETTEGNDRLKLLVVQSLMECRDWEDAALHLEMAWVSLQMRMAWEGMEPFWQQFRDVKFEVNQLDPYSFLVTECQRPMLQVRKSILNDVDSLTPQPKN